MPTTRTLVGLLVMALAATGSGCGLASARRSQDWSQVQDERLFRCCHIGNYGSGVLLLQDETDLWILANSHIVSRCATVHVVDRKTREWREFTAWVAAAGDDASEDFALLRAAPLPDREPFVTHLATPLGDRELRTVQLLPVSTATTPKALSLPAVGRRTPVAASEASAATRERDMMCVFGGVRQANSGTPVFDGDRLMGLNEVHPFGAKVATASADGETVGTEREVVGIGASTPQAIDAFLRRRGFAALADRLR